MKIALLLGVLVTLMAGASGPTPESAAWLQVDWEREKFEKGIPTDTIYIHHTSRPSGITLPELSELHKGRLYLPRYTGPFNDPVVQGQEPHSGHYRLTGGKLQEIFWAYHWLIRTDGTPVQLLTDDEVGWHSGGWGENMRSIAICLDGDFSSQPPPPAMIEAAGKLVAEYAHTLPITRLRAHYDVKRTTECPGPWFDASIGGLTGRDRILKAAGLHLQREQEGGK